MPPKVVSSMDQLGYNDPNISATFGSVYVIMLLTILGLFGILLTYPLLRFAPVRRLHDYLKETLMWNFTIRLVLEGCLESSFCIYLTFVYGGGFKGKEFFGSDIDLIISIVVAVGTFLLPTFFGLFYLDHFFAWDKEEFAIYAEAVDGLKRKKISILSPIYFVIRRVTFVVIAMRYHTTPVLQLTIFNVLTAVSFAYVALFRPFESNLQNNLELLNEFVSIVLIDLCFLFTDLEPSTERQYKFGFVFIAVVGLCLATHIFFLFRDIVNDIKLKIRRNNNIGWATVCPKLQIFPCWRRNKVEDEEKIENEHKKDKINNFVDLSEVELKDLSGAALLGAQHVVLPYNSVIDEESPQPLLLINENTGLIDENIK